MIWLLASFVSIFQARRVSLIQVSPTLVAAIELVIDKFRDPADQKYQQVDVAELVNFYNQRIENATRADIEQVLRRVRNLVVHDPEFLQELQLQNRNRYIASHRRPIRVSGMRLLTGFLEPIARASVDTQNRPLIDTAKPAIN